MVIGLLAVAACVVMCGLVVGGALYAGSLGRFVQRHRRRVPEPAGRPIERVVAETSDILATGAWQRHAATRGVVT